MMLFNQEENDTLCVKCGKCRSVCPVFDEVREEGASPRGKTALVQALSGHMLAPSRRTKKFLSECLLCTACTEVCPNGVHTDLLILAAREQLSACAGQRFTETVLTKVVFANTAASFKLGSAVEAVAGEKLDSGSGVFYRLPADYIVPEIRGKKFSESKKNTYARRTATGFFLGCLIDFINHETAEDAIALLLASGKTPFIPAQQACCGLPALSMGDTKTAARQARAVISLFETADTVVTACGSCGSMLKHYYALLFDSPGDREKVRTFAEKVKDITEVIDPDVIRPDIAGQAADGTRSVTYHDPCHLKRGMGVSRGPRQLLEQAGYDLREMENPDRCCGLGGAFHIKHRALSLAITRKKTDDIRSTGAATVATGCPGCMANIASMVIREHSRVNVVHTVNLLAAGLKKQVRG